MTNLRVVRVKRYSDVKQLGSFEERFDYLSLHGYVGRSTFGFDRYLNQKFYASRQWKLIRDEVIVRDNGCDLGFPGEEIHGRLLIHHMNPLLPDDIIEDRGSMLDPQFLITTTHSTHNAIHYGDKSLLRKPFTERARGDTKLW